MSWHFLQAGEEAFWPDPSLDGAPSALLRLIPVHEESCLTGSVTASSMNSRSGMTSGHSTAPHGVVMSMSSPVVFRVRTSAYAEKAKASMVNDQDSGSKWLGSFAKFDPGSSSWKTHQRSFFADLDEFLQIWPEWGWMRDGVCSELLPLERPTTDADFTWLLTPTAQSWKAWTFRKPLSLIRRNHADGNLQEQLMRLCRRMITPRCQEILMMWPEGWTASEQLEMDGFQLWLYEQRLLCFGQDMVRVD